MTPGAIVSTAASVALVILAVTFLVASWRVIVGPTLPDRILALDTLSGTAIGFLAVVAVKTGFALYIDIAISLGLVGFLATVAFARFVLSRGPLSGARAAVATQTDETGRPASKKPDAKSKSDAKPKHGVKLKADGKLKPAPKSGGRKTKKDRT
ncbi:multicomponent Na+:H+ antiporter subunit F [Rhizobium metallidurans]|uniref:Multicomponent Na+:H+ antiporter subunit F n=1 Tax=Rhizobium metallidurans TaxID=1265931 RepID=A0A7W6GDF4_9HYPH|nr:cation:proton antiporter [Rhizobium metallidurans]MBB3965591.1 multicomponent Na+:H+ antiporter subunit F [Rhizobium metallidurans]